MSIFLDKHLEPIVIYPNPKADSIDIILWDEDPKEVMELLGEHMILNWSTA